MGMTLAAARRFVSISGGVTRLAWVIALPLVPVGLAACNCQGNKLCTVFTSPSTSSTAATTTTAAGIWTGTDSATGLELTGYIDANGDADFIRSDGVQFVGTTQASGTTLDVNVNGYTQFGNLFSDGSGSGTGSFSGTFDSGSTISGTLDFTTTGGTTTESTWSLTFESLYDTASSLDAVGGTYTDDLSAVSEGLDPLSGTSVTISSSGTLYAQGAQDGCVANGTVSVVNATNDLYEVTYSLASCSGSYAVLNGVQFSGLAELNTQGSPSELIIAVTGQSSTGTSYGIVSDLSGS